MSSFDPVSRNASDTEEMVISMLENAIDLCEILLNNDKSAVAAILGKVCADFTACNDDTMETAPEEIIDVAKIKKLGMAMPPKEFLRKTLLENFSFSYARHRAKHDKIREGLKTADGKLQEVCESHKQSTAKADPTKFTPPTAQPE